MLAFAALLLRLSQAQEGVVAWAEQGDRAWLLVGVAPHAGAERRTLATAEVDGAVRAFARVPRHNRLALATVREGTTILHVGRADGGDLRPLAQIEDSPNPPALAWAPGARCIAIEWADVSERGLLLIEADSGAEIFRTSADGWAASPTWSPDGTRLAFLEAVEHERITLGEPVIDRWRSRVCILGLHDRSTHAVGDADWDRSNLAWAPDGRWLVWRTARETVEAVTPEGLSAPFTWRPGERASIHDLRWSPDSSALAFHRWRSGRSELCVWEVRAAAPRVLVSIDPRRRGDGSGVGPYAWSPDGTRLAFLVDQWLRVVPRGGGTPATIATASASCYQIEWAEEPAGN